MPANNTASNTSSRVRLDKFDATDGLVRGRSKLYEAFWYLVKCAFFLSAIPWPMPWKRSLLRFFGARIGSGVVIKPRVNIHFPWKLEIGDHAWIGEESCLLNFEKLSIGTQACVSQRVFLCGGNHDFRDEKFRYRNGPITIGTGAWLGATVFVAPGVTVGEYAVATAGSVVQSDLPANQICAGNPCSAVKKRFRDQGDHE